MKFESIQEINQDIGAMKLYNRTKLAQILFLRELYFRIKAGEFGKVTESTGLSWINATHPGGVVTDQQDQAIEAYGTAGKVGVKAVRPFMKDPVAEGCRPALFAAASPDVPKNQIQVSRLGGLFSSGTRLTVTRTRTSFLIRRSKTPRNRPRMKSYNETCGG
jgi:WW domain-containing oxidoreductase